MRPFTRHFTLFEFIVALALFAMVSLTASISFSAFVQGWYKTQENQIRQERLQKITTIVSSAFRNAIPFRWFDQQSLSQQPIFEGEEARVLLAYRHRLQHNSAIRFIELKQEEDRLMAYYYHLPPKEDETMPESEMICDEVESIRFRYALDYGDELEWYDYLDAENNVNEQFPTAIQIEITWTNGETMRWLRRTSGVDYQGSALTKEQKR